MGALGVVLDRPVLDQAFSLSRVKNQCSLMHSSQNLTLKLSIQVFSTGLHGQMNDGFTPA